jgi:hypothetical protein
MRLLELGEKLDDRFMQQLVRSFAGLLSDGTQGRLLLLSSRDRGCDHSAPLVRQPFAVVYRVMM